MELKEKQKLRSFVAELEGIRGRHTELVSVYIPAGYDIIKIIHHLAQEQGTASNIKDKTTRNHVIDSLERMIRHLRLFKKTPEKGLAVFAGNVAEREGQVDIKVWSIEPPEPLQTRLYRCDQYFVLDLLKDMMEHKEVYGLIVIDRRDASFGLLKGTSIKELASFSSDVPGKTTKGGQSQQRYARLRDIAAREFYKRVGDAVNDEFLEMKELKGIIVGGPGHTKEEFLEGDYLKTDVRKKVVGVEDLSYTGEFGLQELVDKSKDVLAKEAVAEEKKILKDFLERLASNSEKVAYGEENVKKALDMAAVERLILSDSLDEKKIVEFEKKAEETGAEVKMVSSETREGEQLKALGGVGAILRFVMY